MESFIFAIVLLGIILLAACRINKYEQQAKTDSHNNGHEDANDKPDTIGLMYGTLNNIGCQPTKSDDNTIVVKYQGENFIINFGGMYARVWDPAWASIKDDDPDLPKIREAVNAANFNFGPTVVLEKPDDNGIIDIHSRYDIMIHPACPDNELYIKATLDRFFEVKENVRREYNQISTQRQTERQKRRPIGFVTNENQAPSTNT